MNIITNFYLDKSPSRQKEIDTCFLKNKKVCENFIVLCDPPAFDYLSKNEMLSDKVVVTIGEGRPSYQNFFDLMNMRTTTDGEVNILINSDIYIDEDSVSKINQISPGEIYALSRWEIGHNGKPVLFNRRDSQDTWIWRGRMRRLEGANFAIGVPGCDNRIAKIFLDAGYEVLNPSMDIKTIHLHESRVRNYDRSMTVQPPYHFIAPHHHAPKASRLSCVDMLYSPDLSC